MIQRILFGSTAWTQAKSALDAGSLRQQVISENLANATTPGYQAQEVAFEELLDRAGGSPPLFRTNPAHIEPAPPAAPRIEVQPRPNSGEAGGINNVEVERELVELNQNAVHFQALSQLLADRYRGILTAIGRQ
jgi:flagellar basal-body rod protein FlgB